ncbi:MULTISPECIES: tail fiber domain-containing protein [unclassified Chryseobacterium]|uniref:tail fiber domain-containing protein n=1 Tax=unclassified Chryseobacterium TaxID=2593645 RepID=UPI0022698269|nr:MULTISPECIES: tail fiber domain-containing protein [unclassified Chryseobacterium]
MKFKHFYPLLAVFAFSGAYAQVGINTANPQSTLDVVGNVVSTSTKDGVTAPRITRQQLAAKVAGTYAAAQSGTLVYVTDFTTPTGTTPSLAQTANITKVGYYYFDGTVWKQISDTDSPSVNIYNSNGSLTGNRTVTQAANTLAFNGSAVNAFSVNNAAGTTNILSVDGTNTRVGVGTSAPETRFHVVSPTATLGKFSLIDGPQSTAENPILVLRNTSALAVANKAYLGFSNAGPTAGGADWQLGSIRTSAAVGGANQDFYIGNTTTGTLNERFRIAGNGNVGIGVSAPAVKLDITSGGTSTAPVTAIKIVDGNQAAGKILTSDANGEGTWQIPAVQSSVNIYNTDGTLTDNRIVSQSNRSLAFNGTIANAFSVNRSSSANPILTVDAANDRVGIGTNIPRSRFEIVSDNVGGGAANDFNFTGYGTSKNPGLFFAAASGTAAAPTNLLVNDLIGGIYFTPRANGGFPTGSSVVSGYRGDGTTNLTDLMFTTSGTERVRIDPTGNVGIGNTAPTVKLDINSGGTSGTPIAAVKIVDGNQGAGRILTSDANGLATWEDAGSASVNLYNSNGSLTGNRVVTQGANNLTFNGTTGNLIVQANNNGAQRSFFSNTNTGASSRMDVAVAAGTGGVYLGVDNGSGIFGAGSKGYLDNRSGGRLAFGSTGVEQMTIATNGNVGIGTTSPAATLDVVSTAAGSTPLLVTSPANTNVVPALRIGGASATPAVGQGAWIGLNPNYNQGAYPIAIGAVYSTASAGQGSADFAVATSSGGNAVVRMTVKNDGKVGIGTNSPSAKLSVISGETGPVLSLQNTSVTGNPTLNIYPGYTSNGAAITPGNQYAVVFDQDPGTTADGGASQALYDFHGRVRYVSATAFSDRRLKKDIKDLKEYGLADVMKIQPRRYTIKEYDTPDIGVIAQELKEVIPELVVGNENEGLLSVDYSKLSLILINGMKEQQKEIEELKSQVKQLLELNKKK